MSALDPYQMQTILCLIESLIHANHIHMTEKRVEYNFYFWMVSLHAVNSTHTSAHTYSHAAKKKLGTVIHTHVHMHARAHTHSM